MNRAENSVALNALLNAKTRADVTAALTRLSLRGGQQLKWRDLGDRDTNFATVHVTSNPMVSVVERITNAIDATFEKVAEDRPEFKSTRSPRVFAEKALGFKDESLPDTIKRRRKTAADDTGVIVNLWDGDSDETPTVEVIDTGIGLTKEEMPETILSLNKSNKITKWYLMGRFGQGGSTTFAFCEYTIIVSRKHSDKIVSNSHDDNEFSFTVVKYQEPSHDEKDGKYVYLVDAKDSLPLIGNISDKPPESHFNTIVRHVNFRMGKQSLLTLYGKLEYYLFDPVIPFKMVNQKVGPYQERLRTIYGSRDRLNRTPLVEKKDEIVIPSTGGVDYGTIKLRYWLFARGTDTPQKETFIESDNPIVVTYYGQAHSMYPRRFLADCNIPYLQRDLVVQIDCDFVNDAGRRIIFSSTRETTTTEGTSFIKKLLVETLANNKELRQLNRQREEASLTEGFTKEREEMRQTLAEMINRILPGRISIKGGDKGEGDKKPAGMATSKEPGSEEEEEVEQRSVPMKQFPTFIQIINKQDPLVFRTNQTKRIEILTDAPNEFLEQNGAYFTLDSATEKFVKIIHYQHDIYYGKIFISTKLKDAIPIGMEFEFKVHLNAIKPSSAEKVVFSDKKDAIVEAPHLKKPNQSNIQTDAPYPEVVDQNHEYYIDNKWTEKHVAEVVKSPEKIVIYVSAENEWYQATIRNTKYTETGRQIIKNKYVLLVAFYAYLQDDAAENLATDAEKQLYEKIGQSQLEAAARTVLTALTSEKAFEVERTD